MRLPTCSRRGASSLQVLCRCYSSDNGRQVLKSIPASKADLHSHKTLPPAKLRALIALYHQADSWITPANLEQRIDEAFVPDPLASSKGPLDDHINPNGSWVRVDDLDKTRKHMRMAPKMAQWNRELAADLVGSDWSTKASKRELRVIEALYGVKSLVDKGMLPGLELLQENADNLSKDKGKGQGESVHTPPEESIDRHP